MSLVIKASLEMDACAPMKKSGRGDCLMPLFLRYLRKILPARNKASRGISRTLISSLEIACSTSSICLKLMDTSA